MPAQPSRREPSDESDLLLTPRHRATQPRPDPATLSRPENPFETAPDAPDLPGPSKPRIPFDSRDGFISPDWFVQPLIVDQLYDLLLSAFTASGETDMKETLVEVLSVINPTRRQRPLDRDARIRLASEFNLFHMDVPGAPRYGATPIMRMLQTFYLQLSSATDSAHALRNPDYAVYAASAQPSLLHSSYHRNEDSGSRVTTTESKLTPSTKKRKLTERQRWVESHRGVLFCAVTLIMEAKWKKDQYLGFCQTIGYLIGSYEGCGNRLGLYLTAYGFCRMVLSSDNQVTVETSNGAMVGSSGSFRLLNSFGSSDFAHSLHIPAANPQSDKGKPNLSSARTFISWILLAANLAADLDMNNRLSLSQLQQRCLVAIQAQLAADTSSQWQTTGPMTGTNTNHGAVAVVLTGARREIKPVAVATFPDAFANVQSSDADAFAGSITDDRDDSGPGAGAHSGPGGHSGPSAGSSYSPNTASREGQNRSGNTGDMSGGAGSAQDALEMHDEESAPQADRASLHLPEPESESESGSTEATNPRERPIIDEPIYRTLLAMDVQVRFASSTFFDSLTERMTTELGRHSTDLASAARVGVGAAPLDSTQIEKSLHTWESFSNGPSSVTDGIWD